MGLGQKLTEELTEIVLPGEQGSIEERVTPLGQKVLAGKIKVSPASQVRISVVLTKLGQFVINPLTASEPFTTIVPPTSQGFN